MKKQFLTKLGLTIKTGFIAGAMIAFIVYAFLRVLFYEFSFTAWEEVANFLTIITAGGLLVSLALTVFILLEALVQYIMALRIVLPVLRFRRDNNEAMEYIAAD